MEAALIYLASPHAHPDPEVMKKRVDDVCIAALELMKRGYTVFSPIAHSAKIEEACDERMTHSFWMQQDFDILRKCSALYILTLDGWQQSKGVSAEVEWAHTWGLPITYITPESVGVTE